MFRRLSLSKEKFIADEVTDAIFNKLFKGEINRTFLRIRVRLTESDQIIGKQNFTLAIVSLFVFAVDYSTRKVFGNSSTKNKILKSFYSAISKEFEEDFNYIIELARKFNTAFNDYPDEPVLGVGICFSGLINKINKKDFLSAMVASTEMAKKIRLITNYYNHLKEEYKIY